MTCSPQILSNLGCAIVHREADPDSAERLARMAGTYESWSTTERVGGQKPNGFFAPREGTRTRAREFVLLPDEIKRLGVGEAALIAPTQETNGDRAGLQAAGAGRSMRRTGRSTLAALLASGRSSVHNSPSSSCARTMYAAS